MKRLKKTLIVGLGNPILSDDAVGISVAQRIKKTLGDRTDVDVKEANVGGLRIVDVIIGYDRLILVDSIKTGNGKPGQLYRLKPDDLTYTVRLSSPHDVNFATALEIGKRQGLQVPKEIQIYAVEVEENQRFKEGLTFEVDKAVPGIVETIIEEQLGQEFKRTPNPARS